MVGSSDIISHYDKIGYNTNVLKQTSRLVVNAVTVRNFVFLLIARRRIEPQSLWRFGFKEFIDERVRAYVMSVVRHTGNYGFFIFVFFLFYVLLSPYLCCISFLYVELYMYVLADDTSIVRGLSCEPNIYLSDLHKK